MREQPYDPIGFTSRMTRGETIAALLYLPLHVWLLPRLLYSLPETAGLTDLTVNVAVYVFGTVYMLALLGRFLRRDFDPLCDHFGYCILQVLICYGMMLAFNLLLSGILTLVLPADSVNPNNDAVMEMAGVEFGKTAALAIFLAPLLLLLANRFGAEGMFYAGPAADLLSVAVTLPMLLHYMKKLRATPDGETLVL